MTGPAAAVQGLFDAFARRDVDAALALCDPEVEFWPEGTAASTARSEPYRGLDGMRQYFEDVAAVWSELTVDPGDLRSAGAATVVFGRARGTKRDGETIDLPVIYVFKLRGDRVLQGRVVATAAEAAAIAKGPA